ncbi:MAG: hypothetical protein C5B49_14055 [Bdellovibrio sp.]|nr:MAG: hypothetical protein C5B49_14055 [Bdellovibrio sp.]
MKEARKSSQDRTRIAKYYTTETGERICCFEGPKDATDPQWKIIKRDPDWQEGQEKPGGKAAPQKGKT